MGKGLDYNAKLSPRLGTPPPPCPHPFCVYNFKVPNGVRFQRLIFLRESGSSETLEDSSAPLFCGNQDSSETRRDSSAAFFAGEMFQRRTSSFQKITEGFQRPHYFAGIRIPAKHEGIPAPHILRQKRSSVAPPDSRKSLEGSSAPLFCGSKDSSATLGDSSAPRLCGKKAPMSAMKV